MRKGEEYVLTVIVVKRPALKATRDTRLLRVNREFGGAYREGFPLSLPTGERGTGRIAYALVRV